MKSKKVEISESEIYAEIEKIISTKRQSNKKFIFTQKQIEFIKKVKFGKNVLTWDETVIYWNKLFGEDITQCALKNRVASNKHLFKI